MSAKRRETSEQEEKEEDEDAEGQDQQERQQQDAPPKARNDAYGLAGLYDWDR